MVLGYSAGPLARVRVPRNSRLRKEVRKGRLGGAGKAGAALGPTSFLKPQGDVLDLQVLL